MEMSVQADNGSPHYPKRVDNIVIRKRGASYQAELVTPGEDLITMGLESDTEIEAIQSLGVKMESYANRLLSQALYLKDLKETL
jgi:hypothetical protein